MKRYIYYSMIYLGCLLGLQACYDDKSSEADREIPEIEIDTTGIPETLKVKQFEHLVVKPDVSKQGVSASAFSYKWMLSMKALAYDSEEVSYMCIGTEMMLDTVILASADGNDYNLWYQVTDNTTGLRKDILWKLRVQAPYNEGLLVAETFDGQTTDLAFIEGSQFTVGWKGDHQIYHHIYEEANGQSYPGLIKQICHFYNSGVQGKRFHCITDDSYFLLDKEYQLQGKNYDLIYDNTLAIAPMQMCVASCYAVWVNNGEIYPIPGAKRDYPNICIPMGFSAQEEGTLVMKTSSVDGYVAYTHQPEDWVDHPEWAWGAWYDKSLGMFFYQHSHPNQKNGISTFVTDNSWPFDPNHVPNLETRYAAVGFNDNFYMIMRNKTTSTHQIYVIDRKNREAKDLYDIPGNKMDDAIQFVVSENGNVVYFNTKTEIYAVVLGGASPRVDPIYTLTSGEFTHFSMFRQAWYLVNPDTYGMTLLDTHEYLLLAGVWDGNEGTLYSIPIISPNGGGIDISGIKSYPGFGKILTVTSQQE